MPFAFDKGCGFSECILFNGLLNLTPLYVTFAPWFVVLNKGFTGKI